MVNSKTANCNRFKKNKSTSRLWMDYQFSNLQISHQHTHLISHSNYLLNHLKPKLMSFKLGILFILLSISSHLSSVNTLSNQHFNDLQEDKNEKTFLNEFAIELDASTCLASEQASCKAHLDKKANELADKHGFVNAGQVSFIQFYIFILNNFIQF